MNDFIEACIWITQIEVNFICMFELNYIIAITWMHVGKGQNTFRSARNTLTTYHFDTGWANSVKRRHPVICLFE